MPLGFLGKGLELGWIVDLMVYEYHQIFTYTYVRVAPQASCFS